MKHIFISIIFSCMVFCGYAQHAIYYSYDAAGNRISRELRSQPQKGMRKYQDRDTIKICGHQIKVELQVSLKQLQISISGGMDNCNAAATLYSLDGKLLDMQKIESSIITIPIKPSFGKSFILMIRVDGVTESWKIVIS